MRTRVFRRLAAAPPRETDRGMRIRDRCGLLRDPFPLRSYKPQSLLLEGPPYPVFQEVQNKKLLSLTVESGL
ncbi:hypothetical protein M885DRAFT_538632 [Pelagophyceae sp. CCMP2097]|nr:hypothetical protein M885DRAFT_538632 [Pelagophyceae sp. CCMP2097]